MCGVYLASTAVLALTAIQPVYAQVESDNNQLEQIVVTARRSSENLQSTPVAVTALSSAAIDKLNIQEVSAVPQLTPNLTINAQSSSLTAASVYIRGIGNQEPSSVAEQGVGVYLDGVYVARSAGAIFDLVDLERIEVLRGPQGTLFGRNSVGGAIQLISKKPANEMHAELKAGYGRYDDWYARVRLDTGYIAGTPIKAAISYLHRQRNGYFDNTLVSDSKDPGALNSEALTVALQGDFNDLTVNYMFDYNEREGTPPFFQMIAATPDVINYYSQSAGLGGAPFQIGNQPLRSGQQALFPNRNGDLDVGAKARIQGHALTLNYEATPELTIKSISSYRKFYQDTILSLGGNGPLLGVTPSGVEQVVPYDGNNAPQKQYQVSQEFQALGKSGDFSYVAGAYYFYEKAHEHNRQALTFVLNDTLGVNLNPVQAFKGTAESYAIFGQTSYRPGGGDLELTGGLRYTWDYKTILLRGDVQPNVSSQVDFQNLSWLVSANYQFTQGVMAYARVSTGFRSGGINPRSATINNFAPEKALAYEAGVKAEWFDRRLRTNLALFYTDYKDLQIQQFASGTGGATSEVVNAGKVSYQGVELEVTAIPVDGLTLEGSLGYTDPKYKRFDYRDPATDLIINVANEARMPQTSKFNSHVGAQYAYDVGVGELSARVDYSYRSTTYFFSLDRQNPFNRDVRARPDHNVRARVGLSGIAVGGGELDLGIWGNNLTNDKNIDFGIDFGGLGFGSASFKKPRTWGFDAKLSY